METIKLYCNETVTLCQQFRWKVLLFVNTMIIMCINNVVYSFFDVDKDISNIRVIFQVADFSSYLREIREDKGYGVNELARLAKVSPALISRVETGTRGIPKIGALNSLAKVLGISSVEMHIMAGHEVPLELMKGTELTDIALDNMTDEEYKKVQNMIHEVAFQDAISDPDLKRWYMELPQSEEEDLRKLRKMWDIIQSNNK